MNLCSSVTVVLDHIHSIIISESFFTFKYFWAIHIDHIFTVKVPDNYSFLLISIVSSQDSDINVSFCNQSDFLLFCFVVHYFYPYFI